LVPVDKIVVSQSSSKSVSNVCIDGTDAGTVRVGCVVKLIPNVGALVQLSGQQRGRVHITDIADKFARRPLRGIRLGQYVHVSVLGSETKMSRPAGQRDGDDGSDSDDDDSDADNGSGNGGGKRHEILYIDLSMRSSM
jgi:transcriptional accessory protein Tex/SPT6